MMIFNCRGYAALNVSYFFEVRRGRVRAGSVRECRYTRLSRGLAAHGVTKIKMYASRTRGESTSGEVEACPINHPSMKISSSARLSLRERRISAAAATRATRSITGVSKKKCTPAAAETGSAGNSRADSFSGET